MSPADRTGGILALPRAPVLGCARRPRPAAGLLLADSASQEALRRHAGDLAAEGRHFRRAMPHSFLVGLVLDPALPAAAHYRTAREHLRGTRGPGPEAALIVPVEEANRLLSDQPHLHDQFLHFDNVSIRRQELSLLLLRPDGATWTRVPL